MPSWNEKPHVIPTINVNLSPCLPACPVPIHGGTHMSGCSGVSILIPCPIPRSVTFTVTLGECSSKTTCWLHTDRPHAPACPACPIRVACSISGEWEDSTVADVEEAQGGALTDADERMWSSCRDRWELVKALVLGDAPGAWMISEAWAEKWDRVAPLFAQRDAVFSALADMARAEEAALQAQQRFYEECPIVLRTERREERPSVGRLAAYVNHLVEQVGVLS